MMSIIPSTTTSTQNSKLLLSTRTASSLSGILVQRTRTQQQTRGFKFGLWSSYLDHDFEKEFRRRHIVFKHKYTEALKRKFLWDRHLPRYVNLGLKSVTYNAWHNPDPRPGGRWVNTDHLITPREVPLDRLDRGRDPVDLQSRSRHRSSLFHDGTRLRSERLSERAAQSTEDEDFYNKLPLKEDAQELEYEIDPITNRKVYRSDQENSPAHASDYVEIPVGTFRSHRSQFKTPALTTDEITTEVSQASPSSSRYRDTVQNGLGEYDSKVGYTSGSPAYDVSPCGIDYIQSSQAGLREYDEKLSARAREMNGSGGSGVDHIQHHHNPLKTVTSSECDVPKARHQYESTVTRSQDLLKAIQDYETNRPRYHNGNLTSGEEPPPVLNAFRTTKYAGFDLKDFKNEVENSDPLLESMQEYQDKLELDKFQAEQTHGKVDKGLLDVLTAIGDHKETLPRAQSLSRSLETELQDHDSKVDYSRQRRDSILHSADQDKTEDLDLLRASDIRAASGIVRKQITDKDAEKQARRQDLDHAFRLSGESLGLPEEEVAAFTKVKEIRSKQNKNATSRDSPEESQRLAGCECMAPTTMVRKKLTGNFVRDFPEEFEATWQVHDSGVLMPKPGSLQPIIGTKPSCSPRSDSKSQVYPTPTIQTSLDRLMQSPTQEKLSGSKGPTATPEVMPSSYPKSDDGNSISTGGDGDALAHEIRGIYEQKYGIIDAEHRQISDYRKDGETMPSTPHPGIKNFQEQPEPTYYMILAYDPTMQTISVAETTSIVDDLSTPLTPADVLLRLSNAAKFFPHFKPLQHQGYEIVSGGGDVLVFRKVRSASILRQESTQTSLPTKNQGRGITNPIDGMQGSPAPTTGNFASPTGFINYDLPRGSDPPYNIDVRREEPVFSGKSNWQTQSGDKPRRKGRGKNVLISAIWVAGCCYAVGVMAEFFKTGGADGSGIQGF